MGEREFCRRLARELAARGAEGLADFTSIRDELCRKLKPKTYPSIIQVLANADDADYANLRFLQMKPSRTIAGVAPIAIMSKPMKCPHGKCTMCPGGIDSAFGSTPQSYTGNEPASKRAARAFFDPYLQVFNRLEQYTLLNQSIDKSELIVMGGTFISAGKDYREDFVKYAFKALNDFGKMFYAGMRIDFAKFKEFFFLPANVKDEARVKRIQSRLLQLKGECSLEEEQKANETAKIRCVALCIETRPDYCGKSEINEMLRLGTTRVELGVQSIYDDVLEKIKRGHSNQATITATQLLRDSFLKVGYHIMPGLPGATSESDVNIFKELFENPSYRPDMLKIYPCMVAKGTELYEEWKKGKFKPLNTEEAASIIAEGKRFVKPYCRIMRVQRDIPSKFIEDGVSVTNLRQHVDDELKKRKIKCRCLRCREPRKVVDFENARFKRYDYEASNGTEVFLSLEEPKTDTLLGFCRLRKPFKPFRREITPNTTGIRQLHVYSQSLAIGQKPNEKEAQHRGFGMMLMKEAERIAAEELDAKKILVLAGIGAKEYFRKKLGYMDDGVYLGKAL